MSHLNTAGSYNIIYNIAYVHALDIKMIALILNVITIHSGGGVPSAPDWRGAGVDPLASGGVGIHCIGAHF